MPLKHSGERLSIPPAGTSGDLAPRRVERGIDQIIGHVERPKPGALARDLQAIERGRPPMIGVRMPTPGASQQPRLTEIAPGRPERGNMSVKPETHLNVAKRIHDKPPLPPGPPRHGSIKPHVGAGVKDYRRTISR
jgi:hypothetical protein